MESEERRVKSEEKSIKNEAGSKKFEERRMEHEEWNSTSDLTTKVQTHTQLQA